ncbi:hypothetical protein bcere0026_10630 [Bacillus mycoides]|uniref:Uncharacterized protein n=1 Tax=Bacillus mycoides TaxID=1405 RepID=C2XQV4_BACMY|nr:hypothetical protein bcere0026_10630 [Bacillus mycoides]
MGGEKILELLRYVKSSLEQLEIVMGAFVFIYHAIGEGQ